jgi:hypothetical protein
MYEIDPSRTDLIEEFDNNPGGPYSSELALVVNRLRLMPMAERIIIVCTKRHVEWALAKMPKVRGAMLEYYDDLVFDDYDAATKKVFRIRWQAVTGVAPA